jgi:hypothetical protein
MIGINIVFCKFDVFDITWKTKFVWLYLIYTYHKVVPSILYFHLSKFLLPDR